MESVVKESVNFAKFLLSRIEGHVPRNRIRFSAFPYDIQFGFSSGNSANVLLFVSVIFGFLAILPAVVQGTDGELCVVETPLKSKYFTPYTTSKYTCFGCTFPKPNLKAISSIRINEEEEITLSHIHLLQVSNPRDRMLEISLERSSNENPMISGKSVDDVINDIWVAMLLVTRDDDAPPLNYVILTDPSLVNTSFLIMSRPIDTIDLTAVPAGESHVVVMALNDSLRDVRDAKRKFGFVSSVSNVGDANRVSFVVDGDFPESDSTKQNCENGPTAPSPLAECSKLLEKQTAGCYHQYMIGVDDRDIHIMEIEFPDNSTDNSVLLRIAGEEITPQGSRNLLHPMVSPQFLTKTKDSFVADVKRNLTLVLKSNQPSTWTFKVTNLDGYVTVFVGDGDQVENKSSSDEGNPVVVKRREIPQSFDQMILHVLTSIGPPVSYTKTKSPDVLLVTIPQGKVAPKSTTATAENDLMAETESPNSLIDKHVTKECRENHVTVALPIWVAQRVGGIHMTFRDPACQGFKNDTHFMLVSQYSKCGFMQEVNGDTNIYTNFAYIQIAKDRRNSMSLGSSISDDEDFEGSGYGMEDFYREKIPTVVVTCKNIFTGVRTRTEPPLLEHAIRYSLEVFQDDRFLFNYRMFPAKLSPDGRIFARISFSQDKAAHERILRDSDLKLVVQQCWLSSSNNANDPGEVPLTLITKSCAVQKSVKIQRDIFINDFKFAFQLNPRFAHVENVYLHCQVGVCYQDSLPQPSMKRCVDPESYCRKKSLVNIFNKHVVASFIENLVVGPFIPDLSEEAVSSMNFETEMMTSVRHEEGSLSSSDDVGENPAFFPSKKKKNKAHIIVMEGLSTEIVVGIALASFVIGVCLTATMWVIYMKTGLTHDGSGFW